ncbi:MAG: chemotaxis-specific protein-glutamate methyltransferase CheB [Sphingomonas fennica]
MNQAPAASRVRPVAAPAGPAPTGDDRIRVLIVDDSAVVRIVLTRILDMSGRFDVVGQATTVAVARTLLARNRVDVILLDIELPGMDGLTGLPQLIADGGGARVVIVSSFCADGAAATVRALALGAADTLLKPGAVDMGAVFAETLVRRLERIGRSPEPQAPARAPAATVAPPPPARPLRRGPIDCIAIGASTGGIHALAAFFAALPHSLDAPILVTQHLPAPFMPYFASQLAEASGRSAHVAGDGMSLLPSTILVAPGDGHLTLMRRGSDVRVRIDRAAVANGCLPSVDPMLRSVASIYGASAVAVILSGMGRDGAEGAADLAAAGGDLLAQDRETSVVWGMPGAVARAGLATVVGAPAALATSLGQRAAGALAWN